MIAMILQDEHDFSTRHRLIVILLTQTLSH